MMRRGLLALLASLLCFAVSRGEETFDADSLRSALMAEEMAMNAPGTPAADFSMQLADGSVVRLSDMLGRTCLLVLFDPECDSCREAIAMLRGQLPDRLPVIAVYAEGDRGVWPQAMSAVPDGWLAALDVDGVYSAGLYSPEFSPGIYLLDPSGIVLARGSDAGSIDIKAHLR